MKIIASRIIENGVPLTEKYGYFRDADFSLVSFYPNNSKSKKF